MSPSEVEGSPAVGRHIQAPGKVEVDPAVET